jgi:transcriptional regulator with XRE-family HTH domain
MIGSRIRKLRKKRRLSSNQLGKLLGTSGQNVRRYEIGDQELTLDWLDRFAAVLGCLPADLTSARFKVQGKEYNKELAEENERLRIENDLLPKAIADGKSRARRARGQRGMKVRGREIGLPGNRAVFVAKYRKHFYLRLFNGEEVTDIKLSSEAAFALLELIPQVDCNEHRDEEWQLATTEHLEGEGRQEAASNGADTGGMDAAPGDQAAVEGDISK